MKDILTALFVLILFLFATNDLAFSQNETGVGGLTIGSEQDDTYSAFLIRGGNMPINEESKRDIIFNFKDAGMSAIRAYRSGWYGSYLQLMTSQDTAMVSLRPRLHIDCFGKVGIGTTHPLSELDVNGTMKSRGIVVDGDLQLGDEGSMGDLGFHLWFNKKDDNTDPIFISRYNTQQDASELRVNIGDWNDDKDKFSIGYTGINDSVYYPKFTVQADGKVGIMTSNPQNELDVNGTIRANEILVSSGWADFVFKEDYKLPTIEEVERHIKNNGTLPGVPTEKEIKATGVNLAETDVLLLQKIEELTLYIIDLKQEIDKLKMQIKE